MTEYQDLFPQLRGERTLKFMRTIGAVLVRAVLIAVAMPLSGWIFAMLTGGADANIGAGLFAFAVGAFIGFLWALRDGSRMPLGPVAVRWVLVSVLGAFGFWVFGAVREPEAALSDLAFVAPMIASFVLIPAIVGLALGSTMRPRDAHA